ncbi:hypothetical protein [Streptosporangium sp. V21-05]|uniref:hypothetical protein n=1 Tax=Streptosporangium sp. V21-05 TaxID=3446115 RepID=UPI003F539E47
MTSPSLPAPARVRSVSSPATQPPATHTDVDHHFTPAARAAIEAGIPQSTRRAYATDWTAFTA